MTKRSKTPETLEATRQIRSEDEKRPKGAARGAKGDTKDGKARATKPNDDEVAVMTAAILS